MGRIFPKLQPPIAPPDSAATAKKIEGAEFIVWKKFRRGIRDQIFCKRVPC